MKKDWPAIRREVLLEWSTSSDNSPFTKQDLDTVKSLIKEPYAQIMLHNYYPMDIYRPMMMESRKWPPLIGVDVSGGYSKDSSAITVIDSRTTEVIACFNCNYISTVDLAKCIYELVVKSMPNAIVNVERNGVAEQQISAYRVTGVFPSVNCYDYSGKGPESPQRDLRRCA